ncbi:hypothetical protein AMS68_004333 [Peltaster fructicola]|uniref:Uncharacterized protein n=1 Tax=Peltaster fructicola TaxID=286661 RepID=A0A6H0XVV6_9PEZI|nr:hypothetical protein AMS68_004333 [Peltaster fructicola]
MTMRDRPYISAPTDFRREDVSIPGLTEMQQTFIREVAKEDAKHMYEGLQPLRSSPSSTFTDRPLPPYEEYASAKPTSSPRSPALSVGGGDIRRTSRESRLDRVRAHSRKISDALTKPLGPLGFNLIDHEDSSPELNPLMGYDIFNTLSPAKLSSESFSVAGSEEEKMARNRF